MTVDTAIRIVLHSAEVAHFTHKIREACVSPTISQYLKYSGEAPGHYLSLDDTNIGSIHWCTALEYKQWIMGLALFQCHAYTKGPTVCPVPCKNSHGRLSKHDPVPGKTSSLPVTSNAGTMLVST